MTDSSVVIEAFEVPDSAERLERIQRATSALAGYSEQDPKNDAPLQVTLSARTGRITDALRAISDNFGNLQTDIADEPPFEESLALTEAQKELVVTNLGLVRGVVYQLVTKLPSHIEKDELTSAGTMGLIGAAIRFDKTRGASFETFATYRIQGAILDGMRNLDFVPRAVRRQAKALEDARQKLTASYGRLPTGRELAEKLDMPTTKIVELQNDLRISAIISLEQETITEEPNSLTLADTLADRGQLGVLELLEAGELQFMLHEAISMLSENQRYVIRSYYYDEKTLEQIGEELGVTESRVCQICSESVKQLRSALGEYLEDN